MTFQKKIKIWAYCVFILSGYVLLNVCIEYSSAPYYEASVACLEIFTRECEKLGGKTTRLYLSETLYGVMMITQATIALILIENIRSIKLARTLQKACKVTLIGFVFCFLLRLILFFDVHSQLEKVVKNHTDKGLGSFFAEYIDDESGSIIITTMLIITFGVYYASNFFMIK